MKISIIENDNGYIDQTSIQSNKIFHLKDKTEFTPEVFKADFMCLISHYLEKKFIPSFENNFLSFENPKEFQFKKKEEVGLPPLENGWWESTILYVRTNRNPQSPRFSLQFKVIAVELAEAGSSLKQFLTHKEPIIREITKLWL